jgi:DNA-binding HxlR family transcriptional regulator
VTESYGQYFCPITRASEIFATRWTPIIVRNLLLGCSTFSEIEFALPGIPRSVLTERLRQLESAGVVRRQPKETGRGSVYELTEMGRELRTVCEAMGIWGTRWLEPVAAPLDPGVILWAICKNMDRDRLPPEPVLVRVVFRDAPKAGYWLLVRAPEPEVCLQKPLGEEALVVTSDTESLASWFMGRVSMDDATAARTIRFDGPSALVRDFITWRGQSHFVDVAQPQYGRDPA